MGLISRLITAWPQVARRSLANWQLMSTVVVGVLLASTIMAGTVIYFDALRELALKNALNKLSVNETNIALKSDRGPTRYAERDKVVNETEREIADRISWMLRDKTTGVKTATFFLSEVGQEEDGRHRQSARLLRPSSETLRPRHPTARRSAALAMGTSTLRGVSRQSRPSCRWRPPTTSECESGRPPRRGPVLVGHLAVHPRRYHWHVHP